MHPRSGIPEDLTLLAHAQRGVVSRRQTQSAGLSRHVLARLVEEGRWQSLLPGVFYIHSSPAPYAAKLHGGLLYAGSDAWVFGGTAVSLHASRPPRLPLLIAHPSAIRRSAPPWLRVVRRAPHQHLGKVRGALTSDPEMAVVEAASHSSPAQLVDTLDLALATWQCTPASIRALVADNTAHRRLLLSMCADGELGHLNALERMFAHDVIDAHGLPQPTYQHRIGKTGSVVDAAYDEYDMVMELDGRLGHDGRGRLRDRRRDNRHAVLGLITLRFGWHDTAGAACYVADDVAATLQSRGWEWAIRRCSACPIAA